MLKPYYQDDFVTIHHGSCYDIIPHLGQFDLLLTDPQYQLANGKKANTMSLSRKRGVGQIIGGSRVDNQDWGIFSGDDKPFDPSFLLNFPKVILWGAIHYANQLPNSTSWLIWDKRDGVAADDNADCECAWTNLGGPARIYRHLWKGICRAGAENIASGGSKLHPFQKPVALIHWCIEQCIRKGDNIETILDPFGGSGTTGRAAKDLGLKAVLIELEERYCEVAARRMAQEVLPLE